MLQVLIFHIEQPASAIVLYGLQSYFSSYEKLVLFENKSLHTYGLSLIGKTTVKIALSRILKIKVKQIEFDLTQYGQPFLKKPQYTSINFNISHSGNYVAIIISDNSNVGIDIEDKSDVDFDLMNLFCTKEEMYYITSSQQVKEKTERFYELWTLKEAILKSDGTGINKHFPSLILNNKIIRKKKWNNKTYYISSLKIENIVLSLCSSSRIPDNIVKGIEIKKISSNELVEDYLNSLVYY